MTNGVREAAEEAHNLFTSWDLEGYPSSYEKRIDAVAAIIARCTRVEELRTAAERLCSVFNGLAHDAAKDKFLTMSVTAAVFAAWEDELRRALSGEEGRC
jgi:hypothetical protein